MSQAAAHANDSMKRIEQFKKLLEVQDSIGGAIDLVSPTRNRIMQLKILTNHKLQRHDTENSKQIFPEKELRGLIPNFHFHMSVSDLYIPTIGRPILLQENMWTDPGIVTEAVQFLSWEHINGIFFAVQASIVWPIRNIHFAR